MADHVLNPDADEVFERAARLLREQRDLEILREIERHERVADTVAKAAAAARN